MNNRKNTPTYFYHYVTTGKQAKVGTFFIDTRGHYVAKTIATPKGHREPELGELAIKFNIYRK